MHKTVNVKIGIPRTIEDKKLSRLHQRVPNRNIFSFMQPICIQDPADRMEALNGDETLPELQTSPLRL